MPPYLAGRVEEEQEFRRLLDQSIILENLILTGLRGVGKTVLLEKLKPIAIQEKWLWVGTDLTEAVSLSESNLAIRMLTDLSVMTSAFTLQAGTNVPVGFGTTPTTLVQPINYSYLMDIYEKSPGLAADKLKTVLEFIWTIVQQTGFKGIIFAYDEAQNLSDNSAKEQFPLSVMLDVFQSIQRKNIPFMLVLAGLPTLFQKLVEARTYAERMFRILSLSRLTDTECSDAITKPVKDNKCPISFNDISVHVITEISGGYPYFVQFICREVYDVWIQRIANSQNNLAIPQEEIVRKLDTDFFSGRWSKATDRQRELLFVIAHLDQHDAEFSVQEIVAISSLVLAKGFSGSHVNQMLATLINSGLIYKNRYGKYSFAVPLMGRFVLRQNIQSPDVL